MRRIRNTLAVLCSSTCLCFSAFAVVEVKNVKLLSANQERASIAIVLSEAMKNNPEVSVREGLLQVALPQVTVWPKIEKKVTLAGEEVTLMAYQYDKALTRFRALIPYSLVGMEKNISLQVNDRTLVVEFPIIKKVAENFRAPAVVGPAEDVQQVAAKAQDYDESYLEKLLKEKKEVPVAIKEKKNEAPTQEDKVSVALSAPEKVKTQGGANMEVLGMVGKFTGFLMLVIGLFFGLVNAFKKGVLRKGKLGFLNNTDVMSVLNTTYIAPKKSIMLVKVHRQVFLLSNDERGVNFLSEVRDITGLLKNGEEQVSGSNFDTTLVEMDRQEKDLKLKAPVQIVEEDESEQEELVEEVIQEKAVEIPLTQFLDKAPVRDQVKFSEQIKNRVKNLKALQ